MSILNSPRLLQTPIWPYQINHLSEQARGLECWMPVIGGGNYADLAGRGAYFTPSNAPREVGGLNGPAVQLVAASSQYLSRPIGSCTFSDTTPFSGSIWARTTATTIGVFCSTWEVLVTAGWIFNFNEQGSGRISLYLVTPPGGGRLATSSSVGWNDGRWHHLAFTYSGNGSTSGMKFYCDGVSAGFSSIVDNPPGTLAGTTLYVGRNGTGVVPQYQDFEARDLRIASREWSAADVWAQYDPATRHDLYWMPWMAGVGAVITPPATNARNGDFNISLA